MGKRCELLVLASWAIWSVGFACTVLGQEPETPASTVSTKAKRHHEGPLKREDFQAEPVRSSPRHAYTRVDIRYSYRFKFTRIGQNYLIQLTEVDIYAVFFPEQSWVKRVARDSLIDHEQGHFDLTEIYARKANLDVRARRRSFSATGLSRSAGEEKMKDLLKAEIKKVFDKCMEAQRDYDYQTRHGTRLDAQRLHRREQLAELAKLKPGAPPRTTER